MKLKEFDEIRKELDFVGHPNGASMDHGLRVEHAGYARKWLELAEKKLESLPDFPASDERRS